MPPKNFDAPDNMEISKSDNVQIKACDVKIKEMLDFATIQQKRDAETPPQLLEDHSDSRGSGNYNNVNIRKLSPSHAYNTRRRFFHTRQTPFERKLNAVRDNFERRRHIDTQLGLTPRANSALSTPVNGVAEIENQVIERREEIGFRRRTFWKSCCGQIIDRRATQFFVQVIIGVGVMIFCMAKIWQAVPLHDCIGEDTTVYFSLLSALVGFYIPSPSMHKQ